MRKVAHLWEGQDDTGQNKRVRVRDGGDMKDDQGEQGPGNDSGDDERWEVKMGGRQGRGVKGSRDGRLGRAEGAMAEHGPAT